MIVSTCVSLWWTYQQTFHYVHHGSKAIGLAWSCITHLILSNESQIIPNPLGTLPFRGSILLLQKAMSRKYWTCFSTPVVCYSHFSSSYTASAISRILMDSGALFFSRVIIPSTPKRSFDEHLHPAPLTILRSRCRICRFEALKKKTENNDANNKHIINHKKTYLNINPQIKHACCIILLSLRPTSTIERYQTLAQNQPPNPWPAPSIVAPPPEPVRTLPRYGNLREKIEP